MGKFIIFFALTVFFFSCEKKADTTIYEDCDPDGLMAELEWLAAWGDKSKNCTCELSLFKGNLNGNTVFYVRMTDLLCDGTPEAYLPRLIDCRGEYITDSSVLNSPAYKGEIIEEKVLGICNSDALSKNF